jgi:hypothetical protein
MVLISNPKEKAFHPKTIIEANPPVINPKKTINTPTLKFVRNRKQNSSQ